LFVTTKSGLKNKIIEITKGKYEVVKLTRTGLKEIRKIGSNKY